jgi:hypothetical protein
MDIPEELKATVSAEAAKIEAHVTPLEHEIVFVEHTNWHWATAHFGVVIAFAAGFAAAGFVLGRLLPR